MDAGHVQNAQARGGTATARAYDLRHSFVSLLIHEGQSILESLGRRVTHRRHA
jgi:hypothetical protein